MHIFVNVARLFAINFFHFRFYFFDFFKIQREFIFALCSSNEKLSTGRAGLNGREAPGKVVTARHPKRLAQVRSVSHVLVSTLQKHRSETSKLIRFSSLHFRDN